MKKRSISFESMAIAVIILIILMVGGTGFFAYLRFSEVIKTIDKNKPGESKLYATELLFKNITKAENSVKSFSLTKDSIYLDQFYQNTNQAIKNLSRLIKEEDKIGHLHKQVDTLELLIDKKFELLNKLLLLQDPFRVQVALNKVTAEIEESVREEKALRLKKDSNTVEEIYILNTPDPLIIDPIDTTPIKKEEEKKRKFFDWLFNRDKNENKTDSTKINEAESSNFLKPTFDTIISKLPKLNEDSIEELTLKALDSGLKKIKQEEIGIERNLKAKELQLILKDRKITLKIQNLIEELKIEELDRLQLKNDVIENNVIRTNRQVLIFSITLFILLFAMIYILVIYALNNRGYRKAMKAAAIKAEEFAASKSRFLANMSHEIRTPMNAILGFTEQISKSNLTTEQQEQLSIVRHSTDHLLHLVNDILDFSKLESGKLTLQQKAFDLHLMINESISFMQPLLDDKPVVLSAVFTNNVPQIVFGDSFRLRQILLNLISNSIKFTEEGKITVKVDAKLLHNNEFELQINVQDTGIGMNESQSKKVLNEFEQVNSNSNKRNSGTGLGLTITNKLVSLHGGTIQLSSELQKGTSVRIMLPYKVGLEADLTKSNSGKSNTNALTNCKILVADDEQFNRKLITTILNKYGGRFSEVENGIEAVKILCEKEFDVILMDARMPELNGVEATKKIRALKIDTPILAISAAIFEDEKAKYLKAGMNHFLAKPFTEKQLIDAILFTLKKVER